MSMGRRPYMDRPVEPKHYYIPEYYGPYRGEIRRSDEDISRDVESVLFYDSWVPSEAVKIDVKDRVVTLSGSVRSTLEKRAAGDDTWDVLGVRDVVNNLQIVEETRRTQTHG